jgi:hypothetical protein
MKLTISKEDVGNFLVDDKSKGGSPPVGRGRTMLEAIGSYFSNNQHNLNISFDVEGDAIKTEERRRQRELRKR